MYGMNCRRNKASHRKRTPERFIDSTGLHQAGTLKTGGLPPVKCLHRIAQPDFVPWDVEVARLNFGANCGPSAFAATVGKEVCRIMRYFPHFQQSRCWTNLTHMRNAFEEAGYVTEVSRLQLPAFGVALIQWTGQWTQKHFFSRWSLVHTHWIAVNNGRVFDYSVGAWQTFPQWISDTASGYLAKIPQASGWSVKYGVEVKSSSCWFESSLCSSISLSTSVRNLVS